MGNTFREHANIISQIDFLLESSIVCFGCGFGFAFWSAYVCVCMSSALFSFSDTVIRTDTNTHTHTNGSEAVKWNFLYAFSDCASEAWAQFNFTLSLSTDVLIWSQFHTMVSLPPPLSLYLLQCVCVLKAGMFCFRFEFLECGINWITSSGWMGFEIEIICPKSFLGRINKWLSNHKWTIFWPTRNKCGATRDWWLRKEIRENTEVPFKCGMFICELR